MLSANLADASGGSCFPKEATCLIRYLSLDILHVYIYICMYVCIYVCMYVCMCVCGWVSICLYLSLSLPARLSLFIHQYVGLSASICKHRHIHSFDCEAPIFIDDEGFANLSVC